MSTTSCFRPSQWLVTACAVLGAVVGVFLWDWRPLGFYDGQLRCYSQNHEFYVVRHVTLWRSLFPTTLRQEGTARLYRQTGELLNEWVAYFGPDSGPYWSDGDAQTSVSKVYFMGDDSEMVVFAGRVGLGGDRPCYE